MTSMARPLALLATALLTAPALAQPAPAPVAVTGASPNAVPVPGTVPGTVIIVSPQPPVVGQTAAPGQTAPGVASPPQNEDWNNVSHINGQIVKVGERGDYLYNNGKTTSIATNPIGWLYGFYGLSVSHAVHANVAIRGDLNWFSLGDRTGHEVGVSLPIYFRRVFQGPFLEVGLVDRNMDDGCGDCGGTGGDSFGPAVLFGWQWTFDSGLNVAMAFGGLRNLNSSSIGSSAAEPAGYFRVGYAF
jgi:hypothetical protein